MPRAKQSPEAVTQAIAELESLPKEELRCRWGATFRADPPTRASREFLERSLAHRIQEQALGGLPPRVRKRLERLTRANGRGSSFAPASMSIFKPGTRLIREWKGEIHEVDVLEKGFSWRGRRYDSLSRIAREITGTRWSGPVFFGLKKRRRREASHGR